MKLIFVSPNFQSLVDDSDYELVSQFKWFALRDGKRVYAKRNIKVDGKWTTISMHRFILGITGSIKVDHRDNNGLNNQRNNIRQATKSQNAMNRGSPGNRTGFKGVYVDRRSSRPFFVQVRTKGVRHCCGTFFTAIEAARAYNRKAVEVFGEFANLNPV